MLFVIPFDKILFMRNTIVFIFLLFFSSTFGQKLRVYFDHKQFFAPGYGNYKEFIFQFAGESVYYQQQGDTLQGKIDFFIQIKDDKNQIVKEEQYILQTPAFTHHQISDFFEIKRYPLLPGTYTLYLKIKDTYDSIPVSAYQPFTVRDFSKKTSISDLTVIEYATKGDGNSIFFKSGYDIIPRLVNFFPKDINTLPYYIEVYPKDDTSNKVIIKEKIMDKEEKELFEFTRFIKKEKQAVIPIIEQIDISSLHTGSYILELSILDSLGKETAKTRYYFDRDNPPNYTYLNEEIVIDPAFQESIPSDSVFYYLESLIPISPHEETEHILKISKERNPEKARKHIQIYWAKTAPKNTHDHWLLYKRQVIGVEKEFGTSLKHGFQTDRGRIFLKYGAPSFRRIHPSLANEYPYEQWEYNRINQQSNCFFIFYNPSMADDDYLLLHSNVRGELSNPNWQIELSRRSGGNIGN